MKLAMKIILSMIAAFLLVFGGGMFFLTRGVDAGAQVIVNHVDVSAHKDGVNYGKYTGGRWSNEVAVTIENSTIINVDIVKDVLFSKPGVSEELIERVIVDQTIDIDTVSGATITSKAYLKAIEDALNH